MATSSASPSRVAGSGCIKDARHFSARPVTHTPRRDNVSESKIDNPYWLGRATARGFGPLPPHAHAGCPTRHRMQKQEKRSKATSQSSGHTISPTVAALLMHSLRVGRLLTCEKQHRRGRVSFRWSNAGTHTSEVLSAEAAARPGNVGGAGSH